MTDFGLAMDAEAGSQGEVFGSAHYVAPEQARNSAEAVAQSDLYALGIILYEMLTGRVPFTDPSSTAVAIQHLTQPPPPPRSLNPQLNQETETVLLKALSKSPQERYQTGREMLDELELALYLNDATIASPLKPSVAAPAAKNRSLLYIGLAAGFGLTLIFILSLFLATTFFFSQSEQSEAIAATGTVVVDEVSVSDPVPTTEPTVMPDQPTVEAVPVEATATVPPTPEPTPTSGPTPEPLPQLLADTFNDFATNQEGKWRYIWAEPDTAQWSPLRYEERRYGSCWYAEDYIRICPDSGHPGNGADIGWYWTGEVGGPIELQLSASKKDRGGDGVIIAVYYNTLSTTDEPLFQTSLDGRDNEGFTEKIRIENFAPDDSLLLVIRKSRDATSDHTAFQARVCHYACP